MAVQLGEYYAKTGDDYSALNWYEKSPAPGFINKVRRAEAYQRVGDTQSAIIYYEKAIEYKRNDKYSPTMRLGILYSEVGNKTKAKVMYNKLNKQLQQLTKKRRERIKNTIIYKKLKMNVK